MNNGDDPREGEQGKHSLEQGRGSIAGVALGMDGDNAPLGDARRDDQQQIQQMDLRNQELQSRCRHLEQRCAHFECTYSSAATTSSDK